MRTLRVVKAFGWLIVFGYLLRHEARIRLTNRTGNSYRVYERKGGRLRKWEWIVNTEHTEYGFTFTQRGGLRRVRERLRLSERRT